MTTVVAKMNGVKTRTQHRGELSVKSASEVDPRTLILRERERERETERQAHHPNIYILTYTSTPEAPQCRKGGVYLGGE